MVKVTSQPETGDSESSQPIEEKIEVDTHVESPVVKEEQDSNLDAAKEVEFDELEEKIEAAVKRFRERTAR